MSATGKRIASKMIHRVWRHKNRLGWREDPKIAVPYADAAIAIQGGLLVQRLRLDLEGYRSAVTAAVVDFETCFEL